MALPSENEPIRFPVGTARETVAARPFDRRRLDFSTAWNTSRLDDGSTFIGISRDPLHAVVTCIKRKSATPYTYKWHFNSGTGTSSSFKLGYRGAGGNDTTEIVPVVSMQELGGDYTSEHPPIVYGNYEKGRHCMLITTNERAGVTGTVNSLTFKRSAGVFLTTDLLNIYALINGTWEEVDHTAGDGTDTITSGITASLPTGYFSFELQVSSAEAEGTTCSVTYTSNLDMWTTIPILGLRDMAASIGAVRINAASILVSSRASTQYEGGTITGAQLNPGVSWSEYTGAETLSDYPGSSSFNLTKGMYGFHKSTDSEDFKMNILFRPTEDGSEPIVESMGVDPPGGWLVIAMNTPNVGSTYPGGLMQGYLAWGIEYYTGNNMLTPSVSRLHTSDFLEALDHIRQMGNMYENPLHWKDISNAIGRGMRGFMGIAPSVVAMISKTNPELGAVFSGFRAAARLLRS